MSEQDVRTHESQKHDRLVRLLTLGFAIFAVISAAVIFGATCWVIAVGFRHWEEVLRDHFAAIVGLPGAAAVAFVLVVFLRQTDGPIEFEGLGFKFKGASGQVAMWVICFFAIACAIKLCW